MGMLDLLLGKREASGKTRNSRTPPNSVQFTPSQSNSNSQMAIRKDLLKLVLRETLTRNGIPQTWLSTDMLRTTSPRREQGVHVRFLVRVWEPRLMVHGPAFEQEFTQRLLLLDPKATEWLMGFSWQFAMQDHSECPPLPHPGSWTGTRESATRQAEAKHTKPADIIEGPVMIPRPAEDVRADLERLLAARDEDMKRHSQGGDNFAATRPATL